MSRENLANQKKYVQRMKQRGFDFSLVVADAFIRGIRDIGYKSTATALDELIDNAIQADAENILIVYQFGEPSNRVISIAIIDDGHGMEPEMIRLAMTWGGTHRENSRTGFGRYGYGLPSAAVSQGLRYEVYSCTEETDMHKGWLDLDEVAAGKYTDRRGQITVPQPVEATLPDWVDTAVTTFFGRNKFQHGTIILLDKLDRTDWKTDAGLDRNLGYHFGITYRNYLNDTKLLINGEYVEPIDPLFLMEDAKYYDLDGDLAEALPEARLTVRDKANQLQEIKVRFAYLPPTFGRIDKNRPATRTNRNERFSIMGDHMGMVVCRNGRQIDVVRDLPGTKVVNDDRHWGLEIDFPAALDEDFSITTSKQQITVSPRIWELLKQAGVFTAISQLRRRFYEESNRQVVQSEARNQQRASETAMREANRFVPLNYDSLPPQKQEESQLRLREVAQNRAEETGRSLEEELDQLEEEIRDLPFRVDYESVKGAPFYRVSQIGGQRVLHLNSAHRFFDRLYANREAGPRTRAAIEVLLFTLGSCEIESVGERLLFYETERAEWSKLLNVTLERLEKQIG